ETVDPVKFAGIFRIAKLSELLAALNLPDERGVVDCGGEKSAVGGKCHRCCRSPVLTERDTPFGCFQIPDGERVRAGKQATVRGKDERGAAGGVQLGLQLPAWYVP